LNSPGVEFPRRVLRIVSLAVLAIVVSLGAVKIRGQNWSEWERANAIGRHGDFLVIKQPGEDFCYVKQSYQDDPSRMELIFEGVFPSILTSFTSGLDDEVQYWVDDGPKRVIPNSRTNEGRAFNLAADLVGEMKAGQTLHIRVKPNGQQIRTQNFSLLGFAAAAEVLAGTGCQELGGAAIEAKLTHSYTPGAIIYLQSPVTLNPFPDEDSLGLEEVKSGLQLMYIQEQNGWMEFRAFGTGGKSGWITETVLVGKTSGLVVRSFENEAYRSFSKGFWEYSRTLERPGFRPFTVLAFMGDGMIKVTATDDWLAQARSKRDRQIDSVFRLWAIAANSGLPIAVYVYDQADQVRMRQD